MANYHLILKSIIKISNQTLNSLFLIPIYLRLLGQIYKICTSHSPYEILSSTVKLDVKHLWTVIFSPHKDSKTTVSQSSIVLLWVIVVLKWTITLPWGHWSRLYSVTSLYLATLIFLWPLSLWITPTAWCHHHHASLWRW